MATIDLVTQVVRQIAFVLTPVRISRNDILEPSITIGGQRSNAVLIGSSKQLGPIGCAEVRLPIKLYIMLQGISSQIIVQGQRHRNDGHLAICGIVYTVFAERQVFQFHATFGPILQYIFAHLANIFVVVVMAGSYKVLRVGIATIDTAIGRCTILDTSSINMLGDFHLMLCPGIENVVNTI